MAPLLAGVVTKGGGAREGWVTAFTVEVAESRPIHESELPQCPRVLWWLNWVGAIAFLRFAAMMSFRSASQDDTVTFIIEA